MTSPLSNATTTKSYGRSRYWFGFALGLIAGSLITYVLTLRYIYQLTIVSIQ